jgi:hypothetical protein
MAKVVVSTGRASVAVPTVACGTRSVFSLKRDVLEYSCGRNSTGGRCNYDGDDA